LNLDKRRDIYRLLLSNCTDEQRFQITSKLCEEILGAVADGALPLSESEDVLDDALFILASKEIKLSAVQRFAHASGGEENGDDDAPAAGSAAINAAAKSKLLSQVARRNVMQNVVPTLAALKHVLEHQRSRLLGPLMRSLAQVCSAETK
jgi:condensin-2 complex subunit D3